MAQQTMYAGQVNSPETTITNNISTIDTTIYVLDPARVPTPLPNLMTLGTGTNAETVKVLSIADSALTVERGFQGVAKDWLAGTIIARNFTAYDHDAFKHNIEDLNAGKINHSLATAANDFLVASGAGVFVKKTLAQVKTILGLGAAAYKDFGVAGGVAAHDDLATHLADSVTDADGAHGLKYEEGVWTPTLYGMTTTGAHTYAKQIGKYIKINNKITCYGSLQLSAKDAAMAGDVFIGGLPYPVNGGANGAVSMGSIRFFDYGTGDITLLSYPLNSDCALMLVRDNDDIGLAQPAQITNNTVFVFVVEYYI